MKKVKIITVTMVLLFLLCGCSALFVKRDSLVILEDENESAGGIFAIDVKSFSDEANALLLYYDAELGCGIYTERESSENNAESYLYFYDEDGQQLLFSGVNQYTYAYIDSYDNSIYFKESDQRGQTVALYKTDFSVSSKTLVAEVENSRTLPCAAGDGKVVYVNSNNEIILLENNKKRVVTSIAETSTVKKVAYSSSNGKIVALVSISQRSSILYLIDEKTGEFTSIDAGVSDFSHQEGTNKLYYLKTAGSNEQIYSYDYSTTIKSFVYAGSVDKFAVSPKGTYIAFCTKSTVDSPGQSVWLIMCSNSLASQMTANSTLTGDLYFSSGNTLLFTQMNTNGQNTAYVIKKLEFRATYYEKENE